jgi:AraC-like DNA-binding protein
MTTHTVDGPLGRWTHTSVRPAHLAGLVQDIWLFDGWLTTLRERTFPSGLLEIFVHLGDRYRLVEEQGRPQDWTCPVSCVTGLQLGHLVVEAPPGRTKVLGIKLTPAGAYAVFARPMHEVARLTVDLGDLAGAAASELAEACHSAMPSDTWIATVVRWIDARIARGARVDPAVAWIIGEIRRQRGAVSIAALRHQIGFSKARLASTFLEQVGVSPKQFARITRFRHVLTRLHAGATSLSALALDCGYYDQPHMNAEFKQLSGFTPREFLNAVRYPRNVSVAETATDGIS